MRRGALNSAAMNLGLFSESTEERRGRYHIQDLAKAWLRYMYYVGAKILRARNFSRPRLLIS